MKFIHNTTYTVYNPNIQLPTKIIIISDLHFSPTITNEKLENIKYYIQLQNPNYITFVGDIIDSVECIERMKEKHRLLNWLKELGNICPTLISLGGHDFDKKNTTKTNQKQEWIHYFDTQFFEKINQLPNVYLLNNSSYESEQLYVLGYTQSYEYYHLQTKKNYRII